jgi:hypothetical protein
MSELTFRVVRREPQKLQPLVTTSEERVLEAFAQLARSAEHLDNYTFALNGAYRSAFENDAIDARQIARLREGLARHPFFNAETQSINLPTRTTIAALDALFADRSGAVAAPKILHNPSPQPFLLGLGMIAGGLRQAFRAAPELVEWIKWKDVLRAIAVAGVAGLIVFGALFGLLRLGVL